MLHKNVIEKKSGFRTLNIAELEAVSGGVDIDDLPKIEVVRKRPDPWVTSIPGEDLWMYPELFESGPETTLGDYGDGSSNQTENTTENEHSCEAKAVDSAADDINDATANDGRSGTDQPEYGLTIANNNGTFVNGQLVTGQSYDEANPPATGIAPPFGYAWPDVVATVHSHPPSGDSATDIRNQAPSDGDWEAADRAVTSGANPSQLTLYIIDKDGTMRAFDYKTPAERGATSDNPSGNQDNAGAGTVVQSGSGSCSGG